MNSEPITIIRNNSQQGFSLIEAVVAAMISILFISLGSNLVLTANIYKITSQRNTVVNSLIQSDLEGIKYQAKQVLRSQDDNKCRPSNVTQGYAGDLQSKLIPNVSTNVSILNNNYTMRRTVAIITTNLNSITTNADILSISYSFTPQGSTISEYDLYLEIIPNAAFTCPLPI